MLRHPPASARHRRANRSSPVAHPVPPTGPAPPTDWRPCARAHRQARSFGRENFRLCYCHPLPAWRPPARRRALADLATKSPDGGSGSEHSRFGSPRPGAGRPSRQRAYREHSHNAASADAVTRTSHRTFHVDSRSEFTRSPQAGRRLTRAGRHRPCGFQCGDFIIREHARTREEADAFRGFQ